MEKILTLDIDNTGNPALVDDDNAVIVSFNQFSEELLDAIISCSYVKGSKVTIQMSDYYTKSSQYKESELRPALDSDDKVIIIF